MPTYPALKQQYESRAVAISGLITDQGGNLSLWIRNTAPTEKFKFSVVHLLSRADYATLMAFYATNKMIPFDFVFRDDLTVTYSSCRFLDRPQKDALMTRGMWRVRVEIQQQ